MKEAEQERQWKMLQAQRAREQQLGIPLDHQRKNFLAIILLILKLLNFLIRSKYAITNFYES